MTTHAQSITIQAQAMTAEKSRGNEAHVNLIVSKILLN